jgi:hypothetical protein
LTQRDLELARDPATPLLELQRLINTMSSDRDQILDLLAAHPSLTMDMIAILAPLRPKIIVQSPVLMIELMLNNPWHTNSGAFRYTLLEEAPERWIDAFIDALPGSSRGLSTAKITSVRAIRELEKRLLAPLALAQSPVVREDTLIRLWRQLRDEFDRRNFYGDQQLLLTCMIENPVMPDYYVMKTLDLLLEPYSHYWSAQPVFEAMADLPRPGPWIQKLVRIETPPVLQLVKNPFCPVHELPQIVVRHTRMREILDPLRDRVKALTSSVEINSLLTTLSRHPHFHALRGLLKSAFVENPHTPQSWRERLV